MNDDLDSLYENYIQFTASMVEDHDPMAIAAVMVAQGLSIYRTAMDEIDYNKMVDSISANRSGVKKFTPNILQ